MKKKILSTVLAAFMLTGSLAAISVAGPGPNDSNNKGLCTAYFNGQKNGHDNENAGNKNKDDKGRQPGEAPPPFKGLEDAAETAEMSVYEFCSQYEIGGNPGENGRFTECFDEDPETTNEACPEEEEGTEG